MIRKETFRQRQRDFMDYMTTQRCPEDEKDGKMDLFNKDYSTELLCDLTDAMCEIAKSIKAIRNDISQIRRQMPR